MKFHLYGQPTFVELPKGTTVQDLREYAYFNRIMKNYAKMCRIEKLNHFNHKWVSIAYTKTAHFVDLFPGNKTFPMGAWYSEFNTIVKVARIV